MKVKALSRSHVQPGWKRLLCTRSLPKESSSFWPWTLVPSFLSNDGSDRIHYNDSPLLFTYLWGPNLLSLWILLWLQTEEWPLALADCEKHSLLRAGISSSALRFLMGQFGGLFRSSQAREEYDSSQVVTAVLLFTYNSPEHTVPLKEDY